MDNEVMSRIILISYLFLLPALLLWLAHLLSVKLRRALTWIGPVIYVLISTAIILHDILKYVVPGGLGWNFYINSDNAIGLFAYGICITVCAIYTATYYIARAVLIRRAKK